MKDELDIKNLRTYEEDIKDALGDGNVTTTDIVLAEQKKRISEERKVRESTLFSEAAPARPKNIPLIIGGLIFLIIGGGAIYYTLIYGVPFNKTPDEQVITIPISSDNPVNPNLIVTLSTENKTLREIVGDIRAEIKKPSITDQDGIVTFNIRKNVETEVGGIKTQKIESISTADFFNIIEAQAPEPLIRSFESVFILGVHQQKVPEPFILLRSNDFDQSFAGMLEWEPNIVNDVQDIFFRNLGSSQSFSGDVTPSATIPIMASSSASSTNIVTVQNAINYNKGKFIDLVLANKDVRAIQDFTGRTLFFYTFIDKQNLLIATNVQTLELLIRQLNIASLIR